MCELDLNLKGWKCVVCFTLPLLYSSCLPTYHHQRGHENYEIYPVLKRHFKLHSKTCAMLSSCRSVREMLCQSNGPIPKDKFRGVVWWLRESLLFNYMWKQPAVRHSMGTRWFVSRQFVSYKFVPYEFVPMHIRPNTNSSPFPIFVPYKVLSPFITGGDNSL